MDVLVRPLGDERSEALPPAGTGLGGGARWPELALAAAGFVALLFIHEMGHVIQLRRQGIHASAPTFIPFLGAVIASRSLGDDAFAEAKVGLAGPVLGTAGAALCTRSTRPTGGGVAGVAVPDRYCTPHRPPPTKSVTRGSLS